MSSKTYIPEHYAPLLNLYDTQKAISLLRRVFEDTLCGNLHLRRVSAPLFVEAASGLNDDLNGVERPVSFDIPAAGRDAQVVHSLAKWKRMALYHYHFPVGEGLVTEMNAIRRDEIPDNLHSIYVDQWDWEKVIAPRDRNVEYLKATVQSIVDAMADTQKTLQSVFPQLCVLPQLSRNVSFVTSQELEDAFPGQGLRARYLRRYGDRYWCASPRARRLWEVFSRRCGQLGMRYRMEQIVSAATRDYGDRQLSFF